MSLKRHSKQGAQGLPDLLSLEVTAGPCQGTSIVKTGANLSLGRTRASAVCIKDPAVSEKHALFAWQDGCWTLQDLGSSNGTAVNGNRLEAEGADAQPWSQQMSHQKGRDHTQL